jgi:ABC-2 type transport system ATP-binding protein
MSDSLLEFAGVSKWYGPVIAVNDVSLGLAPGITGLVGPNGAGKSTLIKLMTGQLRPSLGAVRICGRHAWSAAAKSHIGYCPDADAFYEDMSGRGFVRTMARLHGFSGRELTRCVEAVLEQVGMAERADRPLGSYSKGMRQRIKLAQALVHDPDLLVLDEPLNGVDPVGRTELVEVFVALAARGKAIVVSSHILDEMDQLAQQVVFLCRGRVLASGALPEIREMLADYPLHVRVASDRPRELAVRLVGAACVQAVQLQGERDLLLQVQRPNEFFRVLAQTVADGGFQVDRMQTTDTSAEAIFDYVMQTARHL